MALLNKDKLDLYIEHGQNVIVTGRHGVGKTETILQAFRRNNLRFRYFSAPTMDPWINFIGVPRPVHDGTQDVLDLIRPKDFAYDEIDALFFDEFNRADPHVLDAVMELIQFKSINGKKFNNLKIIWAAINPYSDDGEYQVQQLDPAILDRFQIHIEVPYKIDKAYFNTKYGVLGQAYTKWWSELPEKIQSKVSPRRVDYAASFYEKGGDIDDVLPKEANTTKLREMLRELSSLDSLKNHIKDKSEQELKEFMTFETSMKYYDVIMDNDSLKKQLVKYMPEEMIATKIETDFSLMKYLQESNDPAFAGLKTTIAKKADAIKLEGTNKIVENMIQVFNSGTAYNSIRKIVANYTNYSAGNSGKKKNNNNNRQYIEQLFTKEAAGVHRDFFSSLFEVLSRAVGQVENNILLNNNKHYNGSKGLQYKTGIKIIGTNNSNPVYTERQIDNYLFSITNLLPASIQDTFKEEIGIFFGAANVFGKYIDGTISPDIMNFLLTTIDKMSDDPSFAKGVNRVTVDRSNSKYKIVVAN